MKRAEPVSKRLHEPNESFLRILTIDVILSQMRRAENDTQSNRRELVRTMFAAIEGYVWNYRDEVRSFAESMDDLPAAREFVLLEKSYFVTEAGTVKEQPRFLTLTAMIRLVTNVAQRLCPTLKVDFGDGGWANLKAAVKARHRITHPKTIADLTISDIDIATVDRGFCWVLETSTYVLTAALTEQKYHLFALESFFAELQAGDPIAVAAYEEQLLRSND
jgi:hypothetical protein